MSPTRFLAAGMRTEHCKQPIRPQVTCADEQFRVVDDAKPRGDEGRDLQEKPGYEPGEVQPSDTGGARGSNGIQSGCGGGATALEEVDVMDAGREEETEEGRRPEKAKPPRHSEQRGKRRT